MRESDLASTPDFSDLLDSIKELIDELSPPDPESSGTPETGAPEQP